MIGEKADSLAPAMQRRRPAPPRGFFPAGAAACADILATLLRYRPLLLLPLAGFGLLAYAVQQGLFLLLACNFKEMTGLPCWGCGLTRSALHLAQGDLVASIQFHLFTAPLFLTALAGACAAFAPRGLRVRMIERVEAQGAPWGGLMLGLLIAFGAYGMLRMAAVLILGWTIW